MNWLNLAMKAKDALSDGKLEMSEIIDIGKDVMLENIGLKVQGNGGGLDSLFGLAKTALGNLNLGNVAVEKEETKEETPSITLGGKTICSGIPDLASLQGILGAALGALGKK